MKEKEIIDHFIRTAALTVGNKVYLRELRTLLEDRLTDLKGSEYQTLRLFINDIDQLGRDKINDRRFKF